MMKLKRLSALASALVLGFSALLSIGFAGVAFAAAPYTCTWTGLGGNANFSTAGNWSGCNSAAPQPADNDNLVFNITSLGSDTTLTNDITGLQVGSITFEGTNSNNYVYTISGNAFDLSGGVTNSSNVYDQITATVTLTTPQTFGGSGYISLSTLQLGTNTLTSSSGSTNVNTLVGSGNITVSSGFFNVQAGSPNYSGQITVDSGAELVAGIDNSSNNLGTGQVIIDSGGTLDLSGGNTSDTLDSDITVSGTGIGGYGAITSCLATARACTQQNTTVSLSGTLTLAGDTEIANGNYAPSESSSPTYSATFNLADVVENGYTLSSPTGSNTVINNLTPVTSSGTKSAPKTPDTGAGLTQGRFWLPLVGSLIMAAGIYFISRKVKHPITTKQR